ncbi:MAG: hypothetical protein AB1485_04895 [Candidatus Thermoplasmatota archaeon]
MSKKRKIMFGALGIAIALFISIALLYWATIQESGIPPIMWEISMNVEKSDAGWTITITDIVEKRHSREYHNITLRPEEVIFRLDGERADGSFGLVDPRPPDLGGEFAWKNITEIRGKPSIPYNITWNDNNNDNLLSVGDTFFINSTGGSDGKAKTGFEFGLIYGGGCHYIYLN